MGVWGLTTLITPDRKEDGTSEGPLGARVCLSEEAARRRLADEEPLTLIIDGIGFLSMLWEKLGPKWEWVLAGQHREMQNALQDYIVKLRRGGVELIVRALLTNPCGWTPWLRSLIPQSAMLGEWGSQMGICPVFFEGPVAPWDRSAWIRREARQRTSRKMLKRRSGRASHPRGAAIQQLDSPPGSGQVSYTQAAPARVRH